ncbi:MAG TPA: hypothetical protein VL173_04240 [Vicinamibacterales bacterium]|nr:hypothetical protein [Vicinamibacterales bacterium]
MFRPRGYRRSPFADFINWTDYRFEGPTGRRVHQPWGAAPWQRRRTHPLLRILAFLAIAYVVTRLIRGRRSSTWF